MLKAACLACALAAPAVLFARGAMSAPLHAQFDHLVVAIRSLAEGIGEFERLSGVKPIVGGTHPGRGTENALVSFGGGKYLEILAPQKNATLSPMDEPMRGLTQLRIINWAVSVNDVDAAVAALKSAGFDASPRQPGSRVTPSGERLEWTTFGLGDRSIAVAPFLINWSGATKHPSTTAPDACELAGLRVSDPASDRLAAALGALGVTGVEHVKGPSRVDAQIKCGSRTLTLSTP